MNEFTRIIEEYAKQPNSFHLMWITTKSFLDQGYSREELVIQLENIRRHFRELDLVPDEDRVMEVMDCFYGWCAPQWNL